MRVLEKNVINCSLTDRVRKFFSSIFLAQLHWRGKKSSSCADNPWLISRRWACSTYCGPILTEQAQRVGLCPSRLMGVRKLVAVYHSTQVLLDSINNILATCPDEFWASPYEGGRARPGQLQLLGEKPTLTFTCLLTFYYLLPLPCHTKL